MLVDSEQVLLDLKEVIGGKSHHGQRDLLAQIARLEVKHRIDEGLPDQALRLYGLQFFAEAIKAPGSGQARVPAVDGAEARPSGGDSSNESKEDTHAGDRPGHSDGEAGGRRTSGGAPSAADGPAHDGAVLVLAGRRTATH